MSPSRPIMPQEHPFVKTLAHALKHRCQIPENSRLLLAVSGGADSLALLRSLHCLSSRRTWKLHLFIAHIQHHLRPDSQSEKDATFVARLAKKLDLPFLRTDLNPAHWPPHANLESAARKARYAALTQLATQHHIPFILTAHHADDQLETLLLRILRGTSTSGLRGIPWRQRIPHTHILLLRPMLALNHSSAISFLKHLRQPWRTDLTNHDLTRSRAYLRQHVLPHLHHLRPDASTKAVQLADHLRQSHPILLAATKHAYRKTTLQSSSTSPHPSSTPQLSRSALQKLPPILQSSVLRRFLLSSSTAPPIPADQLSSKTLTSILRAINDHQHHRRTFHLPLHYRLVLSNSFLQLTPSVQK